jgi:membrane-associated phospholipid phosphatase
LALVAVAIVAALAGAVSTGMLDAGSVDAKVATDAHRLMLRHHAVVQACRAVTWSGSPLVVDLIVFVVAVVLWLAGRHAAAVYVVIVRAVVQGATLLLKLVIDRARPAFAHDLIHATGPSFPSGHASGAASTYLPIALVCCALMTRAGGRRAVMATSVVGCLAVAATRVLLGVHYISDVVAGLALGAAAATAFWPGRGRMGITTLRSRSCPVQLSNRK